MVATDNSIRARKKRVAEAQPFETGSTERVRKLNAILLSGRPGVCLHRARAFTEVYSHTEGEPEEIRFAKAFAQTLRDMPAVVADGELIVGSPTCQVRASGLAPEVAGAWLRNEVDELPRRKWDPYVVRPEQVAEIKEMMRYWEGKTLFDLWSKVCPPEVAKKVIRTGWGDSTMILFSSGFHFTPPWELILEHGLSWYETQVKEALSKVDDENPSQMEMRHFYESLLMTVGAIKEFADKYSRRALELARIESDPVRKAELVLISEITAKVPYQGAQSFYEALQSVCFVMTVLHIEGTGPVYTLGRFDQYLYPFYKADKDSGILTRETAQELIELFFEKITGEILFYSAESSRTAPGYRGYQTISLGGTNAAGKDATNELSYLCMEAAESVRSMAPDIVLLCHPRETPYSLKLKAAELNALGLGIPKFISTETIKTELMNMGYTPEESRLGWIQGCTEPYGPGCKQYGHSAASNCNLPMALEAVLYNGRKRTPGQPGSGQVLGLQTGDPCKFTGFDGLMSAVKAQISQEIKDGHTAASWAELVQARRFPVLFQSLLTDNCIERGITANAGGAKINIGPGIVVSGGLATLADSLAAIKKLVYEEKKLSMTDLLCAIDANFEGYENVREMLIKQTPKYGNDIDYVDDIARDIFHFVNTEARKHITYLGNRNVASTCRPVSNITEGARTWATPDGRKAGVPFSNHVGPTDGMDTSGPTANVNSLTKLEYEEHWGAVHNLYFVNVDNEEKINNMLAVIDVCFSRGGHHIQVNCQDKEVFIEAQKHPEKYRGLMVRVAGYVAYFVELSKELQDQIIGRTSHYA